ncbi:MAG: GNAT family N-acetyltransferase [Rubricoccaceae bacterium]
MRRPASVRIRRARPSDGEAACGLWAALHREHEAQDARYRLSEDAALRWMTDFRTWARDDGYRVFLAEAAREGTPAVPVGLLTAHLAEPAPVYAPLLFVYVNDLYVVPGFRRAGVARALLGEAEAWARATGAAEIRAGVLARNAAARAFWARAAAADYSVTVTLPVPAVSEAVSEAARRA